MASDPTTWNELKARLADWLDRDDLGATQIPEAIALAERRFQRTVEAPERETTADLTINAEAVALPADLWGIRAIFLNTDPKTVLEPMPLADLRNRYAAASTGRPQNYCVRGESLVVGPAPDSAYVAKLTYIQTIPALGSGQATNWLLTDHPDLYLAAALAELHLLLKDDARAGALELKAARIVETINHSAIRRTSGGAPIRIRAPWVV